MEPSPVAKGASWPRLLVAGLVVVIAILGLAVVASRLPERRPPPWPGRPMPWRRATTNA